VFCSEHAPAAEQAQAPPPRTAPPFTPPPPPFTAASTPPPPGGTPYQHPAPGTSPGLAFILGFIPGVGAIYNGQYAKGLVHAVVFGLLISILNSGHFHAMEPLFGILLAIWVFYMAFEAQHTARKRRDGEPVDELSSLVNVPQGSGRVPVGPIILISLGVLLLLDTLDLISFDQVERFWPLLLIAGGAYMLYNRIEGRSRATGWEAPNERR
jgi:TM2 domain-containing membrane protein YozV